MLRSNCHNTRNIPFRSTIPQYRFLSNFHACSITLTALDKKLFRRDLTFDSSEQLYCYVKAIFARNNTLAEEVLSLSNPSSCKQAAKEAFTIFIDNSSSKSITQRRRRLLWDNLAQHVMIGILYEKFHQNDSIREMLLDTGDSKLLEVNFGKWGAGLTAEQIRKGFPPRNENLQGDSLMRIREYFRSNISPDADQLFMGDSMIKYVALPGFRKFCIPGATIPTLYTLLLLLAAPWVKVVCIHVGTNDCPVSGIFETPELNTDGTPKARLPHRLARQVQLFIQLILRKNPSLIVMVCEILPRFVDDPLDGKSISQIRKTVNGFNARLDKICANLNGNVQPLSDFSKP